MTNAALFPTVPLLAQIIICVLAVFVIVLSALYIAAILRAQNAEEAMESQRQFFSVCCSLVGQYRTHADELYRSVQAASSVAGEMRKVLIDHPLEISPMQVRRWMVVIERAATVSAPGTPKGAQ